MNGRIFNGWTAATAAVLFLGACDLLTVSDPQRYTEDDVDTALPAVANGVEGAVHAVMDLYVIYQALLADEYQHTGTWSGYDETDHGRFQYATSPMDGVQDAWHRAQWFALDAEDRFNRVLGESEAASSPLTAQVRLASGFAALYLGMAFCESVPDREGGDADPERGNVVTDMQMLDVAVQRFTNALQSAQVAGATDYATAAVAGRAQAKLVKGDVTGAAADAAMVPDGFSYNAIFNAQLNNAVVQLTTKKFNEAAGLMYKWWDLIDESKESGYMRDPWTMEFDKRMPVYFDGEVATDNETPHYSQWKYNGITDPIPMVHSDGMRLIQAEALIGSGDLAGATTILNALRAAVRLAPFETSTHPDVAMERLMTERFAELFMEGHRAVDLHRFGLMRRVFEALNDSERPGVGRPTKFTLSDQEALYNDNIKSELTARCIPRA